jgi:hypothetical protein
MKARQGGLLGPSWGGAGVLRHRKKKKIEMCVKNIVIKKITKGEGMPG